MKTIATLFACFAIFSPFAARAYPASANDNPAPRLPSGESAVSWEHSARASGFGELILGRAHGALDLAPAPAHHVTLAAYGTTRERIGDGLLLEGAELGYQLVLEHGAIAAFAGAAFLATQSRTDACARRRCLDNQLVGNVNLGASLDAGIRLSASDGVAVSAGVGAAWAVATAADAFSPTQFAPRALLNATWTY